MVDTISKRQANALSLMRLHYLRLNLLFYQMLITTYEIINQIKNIVVWLLLIIYEASKKPLSFRYVFINRIKTNTGRWVEYTQMIEEYN